MFETSFVAAEGLTFLLHIPEFTGSILDMEVGYPGICLDLPQNIQADACVAD
jgi:hypothetical protein